MAETNRTRARSEAKSRAKCHFFDRCMRIAEGLIPKHLETHDGERCFNLYTYLEDLESKLIVELDGDFELSPAEIARFIWCCLCSASGQNPAGTVFNGYPILD